MFGFSQGITFEQGTWKEVLKKAQQINKPIFVEFYTTKSDSCKLMAMQIFPIESVGKVYNENFICYQIDAGKREGAEMAKQIAVTYFPTYIFFNPDGTPFCKSLKAMSATNFIGLSDKAMEMMYDLKPMDVLEKEYAVKKDDPTFLKYYIKKRSSIGLSNAFLFDKYLKLISEKERTSQTVMDLYSKEGQFLRVNSIAFENLQKNSLKINEALGNVNFLLYSGIKNSIDDAAASKDEQLLATTMSVYDQLRQQDLPILKDELYMVYYGQTGETDKYFKYATNYCDDHLMKISDATIEEKGKANAKDVEQMIKSGALPMTDTTLLVKMRSQAVHSESYRISNELNRISREAFEKTSDNKVLKNALKWTERSIKLSPDNAQILDTNANLLYKLGKNKNAIAKEENALNKTSKEDVTRNRIEETLYKMKAGEKTWKD